MKNLIYILLFLCVYANAQVKAFPSAYGAGSQVTGGRGGTVIHVTNLTNNNSEGSFRWAFTRPYPRIIVFDVSGTINLGTSSVWPNGSQYGDVTIAGQTAPEGGITIDGGIFTFQGASNIIVRYIKFRGGDYGTEKSTFRAFQGGDIIIDHCDFWYATDEGLDITDKISASDGNVTVQNNLFAENKTALILGIVEDDAGSPAYQPVSVLNNLFINNSHRFPKYGGEGRVDVINNAVGNWKWRTLRFEGYAFELNEINNHYQSGTDSTTGTNTANGLNKVETNVSTYDIYTNGNYLTPSHATAMGISNYNSDNTLGWSNYTTASPVSPSVFVGTPFTQLGDTFTPISAADVKQNVIDNAGARHYLNADGSVGEYLDELQVEYIGYFENNNAPTILDYTSEYGRQATGVPTNTRGGSYDTDNDGMPDTWEIATFGDLSKTASGDEDSDGYTNIEEFLNLVDGEAVNIPEITRTDANPTTIPFGGTYIPPTGTWTDVEDGSGSATVGGDTVDVNTAGTYDVTLFHTDTDENTGSITIQYTVEEEIISPSGNIKSHRKMMLLID